MNYLWSEGFAQNLSFSLREDILIQKMLCTHDPDGRLLDSELCLRAVEAIMGHASLSQEHRQEQHCIEICRIEVDGTKEPLGQTIYTLSREMLYLRSAEEDTWMKPLILFEMLAKYRWDAKTALLLSAFSILYGEFWVIIQSQETDRLASSVSLLRELPLGLKKFELVFKAISHLVNAMVALTRIIFLYERLPILYAELDNEQIRTTTYLVYVAAYWICRSILVCSSKLAEIREEPHRLCKSELTQSNVVWQLTSLEKRVRSISDELNLQLKSSEWEVGLKIHQRVISLSTETQEDSQEILTMLLCPKDAKPLKRASSQEKIGVSELANKVVLILITKPELLPIEELLLLVQRITNSDEGYTIISIPVATSENWSDNEIIIYNLLSSYLPWYSVRRPWCLPLTTISYIKNELKFKDEPIIAVLDPSGQLRNSNAIDMGWIWGAMAFPFSAVKEEELWSQHSWTIKLLVDTVSPLLTMWAEVGRVICIYGSNDIEWVSEFLARMKEIQTSVEQLEVVYVGKKCADEKRRNVMALINKGKLSSHLSWSRMQLFWTRLESMRRSMLRLGKTADSDLVLRQVEELVEASEDESESGWMIVGKGSSTDIIKLRGKDVLKALSLFPVWQNYIPKLGVVNAIRVSLETLPQQPCCDSRIIRYEESTQEESVICNSCRRPMNKFIVFDTPSTTMLNH